MLDNPYQSPGVVSEEAPPSELRQQLEAQAMEWFLRANDIVVFMLFTLAIVVVAFAIFVFFGEEENSTHWISVGCTILGILAAALAWFQWRYHLAAIVISGALSLATLLAVVLFVASLALRHIVARQQPLNAALLAGEVVALIVGFAFITAWVYAVSFPLQVAIQAWTWHRQGIDLRAIREEIRRRA